MRDHSSSCRYISQLIFTLVFAPLMLGNNLRVFYRRVDSVEESNYGNMESTSGAGGDLQAGGRRDTSEVCRQKYRTSSRETTGNAAFHLGFNMDSVWKPETRNRSTK